MRQAKVGMARGGHGNRSQYACPLTLHESTLSLVEVCGPAPPRGRVGGLVGVGGLASSQSDIWLSGSRAKPRPSSAYASYLPHTSLQPTSMERTWLYLLKYTGICLGGERGCVCGGEDCGKER